VVRVHPAVPNKSMAWLMIIFGGASFRNHPAITAIAFVRGRRLGAQVVLAAQVRYVYSIQSRQRCWFWTAKGA
jgi:hypothetical protein